MTHALTHTYGKVDARAGVSRKTIIADTSTFVLHIFFYFCLVCTTAYAWRAALSVSAIWQNEETQGASFLPLISLPFFWHPPAYTGPWADRYCQDILYPHIRESQPGCLAVESTESSWGSTNPGESRELRHVPSQLGRHSVETEHPTGETVSPSPVDLKIVAVGATCLGQNIHFSHTSYHHQSFSWFPQLRFYTYPQVSPTCFIWSSVKVG